MLLAAFIAAQEPVLTCSVITLNAIVMLELAIPLRLHVVKPELFAFSIDCGTVEEQQHRDVYVEPR